MAALSVVLATCSLHGQMAVRATVSSGAPFRQTADDPIVQPLLTVSDAVSMATNANPQIRSSQLQADSAFEDYKVARTEMFPALVTFGLYGELLNKIEINVPAGVLGKFPTIGPVPATNINIETPRKPFAFAAGYGAQPLTTLIRLHYSVASVRRQADATQSKAEGVRQRQITQVKESYTKVRNAEEQVIADGASVRAAIETARVAQAKYEQGEVLVSEREEAEAMAAQAESKREEDADTLAQDKEQLNQLLGRDVMTEFRTEMVDMPFILADSSDADLREQALANRSELKQDKATIDSNDLKAKSLRAAYIPDVSAYVGAYRIATNTNGLPEEVSIAGAQLAWQPWDWGSKRHKIIAANDSVKEAQVQLGADRNQVIADVNQAARTMRQRRSALHASELKAKAARSNLTETQDKTKNETVLMSDLLTAESRDLDAQRQLTKARNDLRDAETQLEKAVGKVQ